MAKDKKSETVRCVVLRDVWTQDGRQPAGSEIDYPADIAPDMIERGVLAKAGK